MKIFIVAGEASGDILGARLMAALKRARPGIEFAGVGGPAMQAEGLKSLFPMESLSVMGVAEVLPRLPHILRLIRKTARAALDFAPDVMVTIDSPDFCFRVVRGLKKKKAAFPCVHYVAPSVWAWRPRRAAKVAKFLDHILALLPFEPPYFEKEGLGCTFVGHPVVEAVEKGDASRFRAAHGIGENQPLLCVLPGSRTGEVERLAPVFAETVRQIAREMAGLTVVVPTLPHLRARVEKHFEAPTVRTIVVGRDEKNDAFAAATAALAASGTVTLELADAGVPHVVAYRLNRISAWVAARLVKTPFANLVNIVLGREAVPEMLLEKCRPESLAPSVAVLLRGEPEVEAQKAAFAECLARLGAGDAVTPSEKAARAVLSAVKDRRA